VTEARAGATGPAEAQRAEAAEADGTIPLLQAVRGVITAVLRWVSGIEALAAREGRLAGRQISIALGMGLGGLVLFLMAWAGGLFGLIMFLFSVENASVPAIFGAVNCALAIVCWVIGWRAVKRPFFHATRRQLFDKPLL
jgi:Putative Actinobacterial Holin-X, holin superfamily III